MDIDPNVNIEIWEVDRLIPYARNAKVHDEERVAELAGMIREYGWTYPVLVDEDDVILAGHKRRLACVKLGLAQVPVIVKRGLSEAQKRAYRIADNKTTENSGWDDDLLKIELADLKAMDFDLGLTGFDADELADFFGADETQLDDDGGQVDRAEELREKWGVETGQLWQLGEHRLICGDCTDAAVVERVMDGERAAVIHADPPYGMGKEKDGIANDNLYREKLDTFQMSWWNTCRLHLEDNGSVYIWGTAENLWRLWYVGGLRDSERLTLRNEIIWDKGNAQGIKSDAHRMYPTATERALFFMLGEQGFNNNADNYWEGWEPIRVYLKEQRDLMGWDNAKCKMLAGHSPSSGCHWFDSSQWSFVTGDIYKAWAKAANGTAFKRDYDDLKRDYDDLKREFYATRAYFDNTHDVMTDVWQFQRVDGANRHDHATPKPVIMMERIIKSSAPEGGIVLAPFNGSGPEIIACEQLGRRCRAVEISPGYVAVALERWANATGQTPVLIEE